MKFLIMQSSSGCSNLLPFNSKFSSQRPVLKHPQRMFSPYLCNFISGLQVALILSVLSTNITRSTVFTNFMS